MELVRGTPDDPFCALRREVWIREVLDAISRIKRSADTTERDIAESISKDIPSISELFDPPITSQPLGKHLSIWESVLESIDNCATDVKPRPSSIVCFSLKRILEVRRALYGN